MQTKPPVLGFRGRYTDAVDAGLLTGSNSHNLAISRQTNRVWLSILHADCGDKEIPQTIFRYLKPQEFKQRMTLTIKARFLELQQQYFTVLQARRSPLKSDHLLKQSVNDDDTLPVGVRNGRPNKSKRQYLPRLTLGGDAVWFHWEGFTVTMIMSPYIFIFWHNVCEQVTVDDTIIALLLQLKSKQSPYLHSLWFISRIDLK